MSSLQSTELFQQQAYINGQWLAAQSNATVPVSNPATGEEIGTIPNMGAAEATQAIEAAYTALQSWKALTAQNRADILLAWHKLVLDYTDELALIMTIEQGKPLAEAKGEVRYAASFIQWFAEEGKRIYGDVIPTVNNQQRFIISKEPVGVVAAITPWNFPIAMITRKAAPALAAGCTVVIKPANETPYCALAIAKLAEKAGIPAGVINVVTGKSQEIGSVFTSHEKVKKLTFTGSTPVGRLLMQQCSSTIKKLALELGGNAPLIVFDDADLDKAVQGAIFAKFRNAGQTCVCANRIYVHDNIYQAFAEKFVQEVQKFKVGNGLEDGVQIGPLINEKAVLKAQQLIDDAVSKGAKIACGGKQHALGQTFYEPSVLTNVDRTMEIVQEEIFGPVAPLIRFTDEADVVAQANDTIFGLAAYVYSENISRLWRVSEQLEYGMVGMNATAISNEVVPFGGVKQSGVGREGSKYGLEEFMTIKYMCLGL
ncbi:TPA: NAD-dependent succinate-semialdehyde dehydrogenase [Acinetobacter baumannii]|uniref:NAD-dependent succinate-semialdehyde dehydrogenase n=12 Tax=Acinetobacter baumannii TaxID=470 RepID=A0A219CN06_ACIBA|nr:MULTISPECIES: NAD-dependent succinate-semialdehyde dehydrogenase [Acinetobacter]ADX91273.1 NAD-dependent aldehyde dehydrogenase [Acinetobacter baumannii TCDC-AB0715]AHX29673.1 succinate-semialdehyde dehydrogenase [Acinetobacter baumannii AC12]AHX66159.1 succinate-semialdehyde dehydrogenase [Acinetobacter baumannii AC30]EMT85073.1 NAD-dependent aldehyde dehydrogenase [Acinetobacter baumannii ABNIH5]ETY67530.1 succinate-semialdehyde dehdyrogenase [Acinetobacter baumannii MDR_MMC4]EXB13303.1 